MKYKKILLSVRAKTCSGQGIWQGIITGVINSISMFVPLFVLPPLMVYGINGVTEFWDAFWQMSIILWIQGLFDRFFIDWYWVGKTKAWEIPGTEDLKPYIPTKVMIGKWLSTVLMNPLIALIIAGVMQFII